MRLSTLLTLLCSSLLVAGNNEDDGGQRTLQRSRRCPMPNSSCQYQNVDQEMCKQGVKEPCRDGLPEAELPWSSVEDHPRGIENAVSQIETGRQAYSRKNHVLKIPSRLKKRAIRTSSENQHQKRIPVSRQRRRSCWSCGYKAKLKEIGIKTAARIQNGFSAGRRWLTKIRKGIPLKWQLTNDKLRKITPVAGRKHWSSYKAKVKNIMRKAAARVRNVISGGRRWLTKVGKRMPIKLRVNKINWRSPGKNDKLRKITPVSGRKHWSSYKAKVKNIMRKTAARIRNGISEGRQWLARKIKWRPLKNNALLKKPTQMYDWRKNTMKKQKGVMTTGTWRRIPGGWVWLPARWVWVPNWKVTSRKRMTPRKWKGGYGNPIAANRWLTKRYRIPSGRDLTASRLNWLYNCPPKFRKMLYKMWSKKRRPEWRHRILGYPSFRKLVSRGWKKMRRPAWWQKRKIWMQRPMKYQVAMNSGKSKCRFYGNTHKQCNWRIPERSTWIPAVKRKWNNFRPNSAMVTQTFREDKIKKQHGVTVPTVPFYPQPTQIVPTAAPKHKKRVQESGATPFPDYDSGQ